MHNGIVHVEQGTKSASDDVLCKPKSMICSRMRQKFFLHVHSGERANLLASEPESCLLFLSSYIIRVLVDYQGESKQTTHKSFLGNIEPAQKRTGKASINRVNALHTHSICRRNLSVSYKFTANCQPFTAKKLGRQRTPLSSPQLLHSKKSPHTYIH